jgi:hypothetical protein
MNEPQPRVLRAQEEIVTKEDESATIRNDARVAASKRREQGVDKWNDTEYSKAKRNEQAGAGDEWKDLEWSKAKRDEVEEVEGKESPMNSNRKKANWTRSRQRKETSPKDRFRKRGEWIRRDWM